MRKCVEWEDKTSNWDAYSVTVARLYLASGEKFDRCTLLFLLIENANEAGQGERSLKYCDEVETLKEVSGSLVKTRHRSVSTHSRFSFVSGLAFRTMTRWR